MVRALVNDLPVSLADLYGLFSVSQDKTGRQLVQLFGKPRLKNSTIRRATVKTHPVEWQRCIKYAELDIVAMPEIDKKLPTWNNANQELTFWQRDKPINGRGVFMDVQQAEAAVTAAEVLKKALVTITRELIDNEVQAATQRDTMLKHLTGIFAIEFPDRYQR